MAERMIFAVLAARIDTVGQIVSKRSVDRPPDPIGTEAGSIGRYNDRFESRGSTTVTPYGFN